MKKAYVTGLLFSLIAMMLLLFQNCGESFDADTSAFTLKSVNGASYTVNLPDSAVTGQTASFSISTNANVSNVNWLIEGQEYTGEVAVHSFNTAGLFNVSVSFVLNNDKSPTVFNSQVRVNLPTPECPAANLTNIQVTAVGTLETGKSISFLAIPPDCLDLDTTLTEWDFGDEGIATGALVSHTFSTAGTHTITATLEDDTVLSTEISLVAVPTPSPIPPVTIVPTGTPTPTGSPAPTATPAPTLTPLEIKVQEAQAACRDLILVPPSKMYTKQDIELQLLTNDTCKDLITSHSLIATRAEDGESAASAAHGGFSNSWAYFDEGQSGEWQFVVRLYIYEGEAFGLDENGNPPEGSHLILTVGANFMVTELPNLLVTDIGLGVSGPSPEDREVQFDHLLRLKSGITSTTSARTVLALQAEEGAYEMIEGFQFRVLNDDGSVLYGWDDFTGSFDDGSIEVQNFDLDRTDKTLVSIRTKDGKGFEKSLNLNTKYTVEIGAVRFGALDMDSVGSLDIDVVSKDHSAVYRIGNCDFGPINVGAWGITSEDQTAISNLTSEVSDFGVPTVCDANRSGDLTIADVTVVGNIVNAVDGAHPRDYALKAFIRGDCNADGTVGTTQDGQFALMAARPIGAVAHSITLCDCNNDGVVNNDDALAASANACVR